MFQYKILNNILILNKLPFRFKKDRSPMCSFCNSANETPWHIFYTLILQGDYETSFNILFLGIFIFLKSLHRVPSSDSLISAINNRIFYLLLIFMELFVYQFEIVLGKDQNNTQNSPCISQKKVKYPRKQRVIENILKQIYNQKFSCYFLFLSIRDLHLILILSILFVFF